MFIRKKLDRRLLVFGYIYLVLAIIGVGLIAFSIGSSISHGANLQSAIPTLGLLIVGVIGIFWSLIYLLGNWDKYLKMTHQVALDLEALGDDPDVEVDEGYYTKELNDFEKMVNKIDYAKATFGFFNVIIFGTLITLPTELIINLFGIRYNAYAFEQIYEIIFFVVLISFFYKFEYFADIRRFFAEGFRNFFLVIGFYLLLVFASIIFSVLAGYFFPVQGAPANQQIIDTLSSDPSTRIWITLSAVIGAPIIEEFGFRFLLVGKLLRRLPVYSIVILGTLIFSFMHAIAATAPNQFFHDLISYSGPSLVFVVAYLKNKNIAFTMSLHFLNNLIAFLPLLIMF